MYPIDSVYKEEIMAKSKALVRAEVKLMQLQRALKEAVRRVKLLALKDAKAALLQKKTAVKKTTTKKGNKNVSLKKKPAKKKASLKSSCSYKTKY